MEITFLDKRFCCWGSGSQGGTYLLRLTVNAQLTVRFGRFHGGEPIYIPVGDYFYIGSALGQKGSTSLARRLLRHASRSDATAPHAIRAEMVRLFAQLGLGPTPLRPPTGKKRRWHVDYLLDEIPVDLTAVYLMRSPEISLREGGSLETAVARWLLTFPEVVPLVAGLGSTDDPGGTHLLKVRAVPHWWAALPNRLTCFLQEQSA